MTGTPLRSVRVPDALVPIFTQAQKDVSRWSIPVEDEATFRAWMGDYEKEIYRHTDDGGAVARAIADEFPSRWFPRPLQYLGHQLLRAASDDHLLKSVNMPPPAPAARRAVPWVLRSYTRGRRVLPRATDGLVSPWNAAYGGGEPDPLTVGRIGRKGSNARVIGRRAGRRRHRRIGLWRPAPSQVGIRRRRREPLPLTSTG